MADPLGCEEARDVIIAMECQPQAVFRMVDHMLAESNADICNRHDK